MKLQFWPKISRW